MPLLLAIPFLLSETATAQSIQIRPLLYDEKLEPGETKKGYVDIANPLNKRATLKTDVQGFKQIDNQGNLEFFDVDYLKAAITPDYEEFTLGPHEAIRLYFAIDSKKLPEGDNFAALFARSTSGTEGEGIATEAQVGTLLALQNGEGGPRDVALNDLSLPWVFIGDEISGSVKAKNTADPEKSIGFFPQLKTSLGPLFPTEKYHKGPLVFAGIEREVGFSLPSNHFGFYEFTVTSHGAQAGQWMFLITGWWRWVGLGVLVAIATIFIFWRFFYKKRIHYRAHPHK